VSQVRIIERAFLLTALFATAAAPRLFSQRLRPAPRLHTGQILLYRIDFSSSRNMKTESAVSFPQLPPSSTLSATGLLQVEILDAGTAGLNLKTYYSERDSSAGASQSRSSKNDDSGTSDKMVEVSIASNGSATRIRGLEQLSAAQQFAWNDWLGRFTSSMTFPAAGVRAGQKWQTSEPETDPSPIAALSWTKKYQYVRDQPCLSDEQPQKASGKTPSSNARVCAVILIRSTLRQKSPAKNATPGDYKLRGLKTRGSAAGQNETILYFERFSGLLARSTEDAQQAMDVVVALADGSNAVHYTLDAKSHSDILLLSDTLQSAH
jgi:hypothetical protein